MDCSPPGSSVHGISQARVLEWIAISFSGDLIDPGFEPASPALAGRVFTIEPPGKLLYWIRTPFNDFILPGSSAKTLIPNRVTFPGTRGYDISVSFGGTQYNSWHFSQCREVSFTLYHCSSLFLPLYLLPCFFPHPLASLIH